VREGAEELAARVEGAEVVGVIGRVFVMWRRLVEKPDSPR
jgi:RNA-binding protein YhbY